MGSQTTTTTEKVQGPGSQENELLQQLMKMVQGAGGAIDMAALGKLASGQMQGPTESDYNLVQQSIGRTGEMAQREFQRQAGQQNAAIGENLTSRGIKGSSAELLQNLLGGQEMQGRLADLMAQSQNQGGQALMQLPFQRNEQQMGANQLLFNMLTGASAPALQTLLTGRLANRTTTQKTPMNPMEIAGMAAKIGAAIPTGGASMVMPTPGGAGGMTFNSGMAGLGMYGPGGR